MRLELKEIIKMLKRHKKLSDKPIPSRQEQSEAWDLRQEIIKSLN